MVCTPDAQKCIGDDLYECQIVSIDPYTGPVYDWVLIERDSPQCVAPPPPECTPGETKCVGYDLYTCGIDEKWALTKRNSPQCGYTPPEEPASISITAPDSAEEGESVPVSVEVTNNRTIGYMYKIEISAVPDLFPAFRIGTIEKYIDSGSTFTAYGSFTMPASNTTILIWVERWAVDHWVYDNSASKVVSLEVVPEYKGSIARKELEYDETRGNIPVY